MSGQLRYVQSYEAMVEANFAAYPEAEAVAISVGGEFERIGRLEYALLRRLGLRDGQRVVDVGCGGGRLAVRLAELPELGYLGLDVVGRLLAYAEAACERPDFRFRKVDEIAIPEPAGSADFVTFFSVFTHLLHEESFVYLQEAARVLKPGGRVVFSFLEFAVASNWSVFLSNVDWVRQRFMGHINVFMHPDDLRLWSASLGLAIDTILSGDERLVEVTEAEAGPELPMGRHAFGQSVCVMSKPA